MSEIELKIKEALIVKQQSYENALTLLEEAHLMAQPYPLPHLYVHWKMFRLALEFKDWKEVFGQIPRILLAAPGSYFGKAPKGNVGSTKMGIFEKRSEDHTSK